MHDQHHHWTKIDRAGESVHNDSHHRTATHAAHELANEVLRSGNGHRGLRSEVDPRAEQKHSLGVDRDHHGRVTHLNFDQHNIYGDHLHGADRHYPAHHIGHEAHHEYHEPHREYREPHREHHEPHREHYEPHREYHESRYDHYGHQMRYDHHIYQEHESRLPHYEHHIHEKPHQSTHEHYLHHFAHQERLAHHAEHVVHHDKHRVEHWAHYPVHEVGGAGQSKTLAPAGDSSVATSGNRFGNDGIAPTLASPSQTGFGQKLLEALNLPVTAANLHFLDVWQRAEGGSIDNPFNTCQPSENARTFNGYGVKRYSCMEEGLQATIKTLTNGYYNNILAALGRDDVRSAALALRDSAWGTKNIMNFI